jgi:hypothetical protein
MDYADLNDIVAFPRLKDDEANLISLQVQRSIKFA